MSKNKKPSNQLATNRKALHDYFIEESYEAGLELFGTEVKSIRAGKVQLKESYAQIRNGEVFVIGMHISPYEQGNIFNKDPMRDKKLLLHKYEINKLMEFTSQKGYTLVPLSLYLVRGRVKLKLGVAKGKHNYDKRQSLKEKSAKRDIQKQMKNAWR
ncbi:SsrA-binding protein SmpB [Oceanirhabdus sp. W0125-5]|uniref:SsrA-binding protein SmpB n=1 Tax=Oceanirhabdus sp. W0125-5 TaxID=2999116 RepID=UPI0022F2A731|nr:SsrA-binding protein SmpB [Oceanirhabdus sp. W0125-5]WBW98586.1 SsrA-binding protein SmpB [Oceanirhabdus sp. W0125-5]